MSPKRVPVPEPVRRNWRECADLAFKANQYEVMERLMLAGSIADESTIPEATYNRLQADCHALRTGEPEPNMDAIKTREINVLVTENNVLRAALTDFVRDAEFRACEESTPGLLLRLAKGRSALADLCRPEQHESKLHAALKETLDCLINETAGNHDTPWVESVKNHANTVLANEH